MTQDAFYFRGGKSASNLSEFYEVLKEMSQEEFESHVNESKNDFAQWIEHSLDFKELADELRDISDMMHVKLLVLDAIKMGTPKADSTQEKAQIKDDAKELSNNTEEEKQADSTENSVDSVQEEKKEKPANEDKKEDVKTSKGSEITHPFHESSLKHLLLGAGFGIILGMVLMLILVNLGIF